MRANIEVENSLVENITSGNTTSEAMVRRTEIPSMTCRALATANSTLMRFIAPKPVSRRTCVRSLVARLAISPAGILR